MKDDPKAPAYKAWLAPAVIFAVLSAGAGFLGSYGGKQQAEGADKQELKLVREEVNRLREQKYITRDEFDVLNKRIDELNQRIIDWRKKRDESDERTMEMLRGISKDVNTRYSK